MAVPEETFRFNGKEVAGAQWKHCRRSEMRDFNFIREVPSEIGVFLFFVRMGSGYLFLKRSDEPDEELWRLDGCYVDGRKTSGPNSAAIALGVDLE